MTDATTEPGGSQQANEGTQQGAADKESGTAKPRRAPKWTDPLRKPELMPADLRDNSDYTDEERMTVWRKRLWAKTVRNRSRQAEAWVAKQRRKDEEHRKYVLGGVIEAEIRELKNAPEVATQKRGEAIAKMIDEILLKRVLEHEQFLFKNVFPKATRPARGKAPSTDTETNTKRGTETDANVAAESSAENVQGANA